MPGILSACGITAQGQHVIRLFNVDNNYELLRDLAGHRSKILTVAFNHDGSSLASGSSSGEIMIWNSLDHSGCSNKALQICLSDEIYALKFSSFEDILAVRYGRGVCVWSISGVPTQVWQYSCKPMYESSISFIGSQHGFVITPVSRKQNGDENTVVVWRSHEINGKEIHSTATDDGMYDISVAQDCSLVAAMSAENIRLWMWCSKTLSLIPHHFLSIREYAHQIMFAISDDMSQKLYCICDDRMIGWDVSTWARESNISLPYLGLRTFNPMQKKLAVVEFDANELGNPDQKIVLHCDSTIGCTVTHLASGLQEITDICYSPSASVILL